MIINPKPDSSSTCFDTICGDGHPIKIKKESKRPAFKKSKSFAYFAKGKKNGSTNQTVIENKYIEYRSPQQPTTPNLNKKQPEIDKGKEETKPQIDKQNQPHVSYSNTNLAFLETDSEIPLPARPKSRERSLPRTLAKSKSVAGVHGSVVLVNRIVPENLPPLGSCEPTPVLQRKALDSPVSQKSTMYKSVCRSESLPFNYDSMYKTYDKSVATADIRVNHHAVSMKHSGQSTIEKSAMTPILPPLSRFKKIALRRTDSGHASKTTSSNTTASPNTPQFCNIAVGPSDYCPTTSGDATTTLVRNTIKPPSMKKPEHRYQDKLARMPSFQKKTINNHFVNDQPLTIQDLNDCDMKKLNEILRRQNLTPADIKIMKEKAYGRSKIYFDSVKQPFKVNNFANSDFGSVDGQTIASIGMPTRTRSWKKSIKLSLYRNRSIPEGHQKSNFLKILENKDKANEKAKEIPFGIRRTKSAMKARASKKKVCTTYSFEN